MTVGRAVRVRIAIAAALATLALGGIGYRAWGIQVEAADEFRRQAERQHLRRVEVPAPRGDIRDARGRELAVTAEASSVFVNPREVEDVAGTAAALAGALGMDLRFLEERLAGDGYFAWIRRHVTAEDARRVEALDLPGVGLTAEPRRFYPGRELAGPVLGFAGIDGDGLAGVELVLDDLLHGRRAETTALRDAAGRVMLSDGTVEPVAGATVTLTLDRAIQFLTERALREAVEAHDAKAGIAVVLDVTTGEVLAMASAPTFDPNRPQSRTGARNRAVTDAYEIGSVMKVFTIAAALEAGVVRPDQWIDTEGGRIRLGRRVIRDTHRDESLTVAGVLKRSSNVGAIKIARRLGAEALAEALVRYGFGARTGIELPGERAGLVRPGETWGEADLAVASYGYFTTATVLQVAAGFAAIGNGGVYNEPRIVRRVTDADGRVLFERRSRPRRVMRAEVARQMLPILASVFDKGRDGGTARSVDVDGFRAGGKTGTAHKIDPETRAYGDDLYLSSFAGLAPIDDPRIAVVVVIDEPRGEHHYGATVAGPAFATIVAESLRYLGVPATEPAEADAGAPPTEQAEPDEPVDDDVASAAEPPLLPPGATPTPDVSGMSIRRALDTAAALGVEVEITGSGRAVSQNPPPGAALGDTLRISFARGRSAARD